MRKTGEGQIKVVAQLAVLELVGLREAFPYALQVSGERCFEVRQRRCANVVTNDKEEERALARAIIYRSYNGATQKETSVPLF